MFVADKQRYKLKLSRLDFISPVDTPAQETAKVCLIKRKAGENVAITASVAKVDDELGLVFGWAFTSQIDGNDYFDLQGDAITPDFVKAAADFMIDGGLTDEMHDSNPDGRVVFCMPLTPDIAKSFGVVSKTIGLMVALKPSSEVFEKFKTGEYTGFSIAGEGERTAVKRRVGKAVWTTADIDNLPNSSFLYIEPGGTPDKEGKTTPRSLRHFPYRDENNKIDIDHLRDAISRIPQSSLPVTLRNKLQVKAEKLLAAQHTKRAPTGKCAACGNTMPVDKDACPDCGGAMAYKRVIKAVAITDEVDGHQHALDLDEPAGWCGDRQTTSWAQIEGVDTGHCHIWTFDEQTGAITIAADSGHTHTVDAVVPPEVLATFMLNERADAASSAQQTLERLVDEGAPVGVSVTIASRAPEVKSTPQAGARSVVITATEKSQMNLLKTVACLIAMSDTQRAYVGKLAPDEVEPFLQKSASDRDAIVRAAGDADPIVFKGTTTNIEVRASHGEFARKMAEQNENNATTIAKQQLEITKANEARQVEIYKAKAKSDIGYLAGSDDAKVALLKAIDGIADEKVRGEVTTALKAADAVAKELGKPKGANPGEDAEGAAPLEKFEAGITKYALDHKLANRLDAYEPFLKTAEGKALKADYDDQHPSNHAHQQR